MWHLVWNYTVCHSSNSFDTSKWACWNLMLQDLKMYRHIMVRTLDPRINIPMLYRPSHMAAIVTFSPPWFHLKILSPRQASWETYFHTLLCEQMWSWSHTATKCHRLRKVYSCTEARAIDPRIIVLMLYRPSYPVATVTFTQSDQGFHCQNNPWKHSFRWSNSNINFLCERKEPYPDLYELYTSCLWRTIY